MHFSSTRERFVNEIKPNSSGKPESNKVLFCVDFNARVPRLRNECRLFLDERNLSIYAIKSILQFGLRRQIYDPDPLAEKYYNTSPYAYCGNNPINRVDPTGMIWDNVKEAEKLKNNIDSRVASLNKNIAKNQAKLGKGGLNEKQIAKLESKISEANDRISNLNASKADIDVLGADQNNVYALNQTNGGIHQVKQGGDGKVYIETSSDALSIHEITHVRQSLDAGGLKFSSNGELLNSGTSLKSVAKMEVEAYKRQYSYDLSFPGSTSNLQGIDVHSVGNIMNNGTPVYPLINQYSHDLKNFIKQQQKLLKNNN